MYVDTDMLRMGADFSKSAGEIVKRGGAEQFASTTVPPESSATSTRPMTSTAPWAVRMRHSPR